MLDSRLNKNKFIFLEPQVAVTATIVQGLLESMDDRLLKCYTSQFRKLIVHMKNHFIPRIAQITPPGKSASQARLELYLEKYGK